ncbi:unnamed protein product [Chilo suppressalis]|uniref:Uncharacterized protein n=1 Tax=Chilo suppressalis TaxID=168631 RepID=A0ABN8B1H6_CHISP|nr:unnamed protein product [Chilo suppressalis]
MKKFTFKGVLDGFRSSVQAAPRGVEQEIQETLRPDHFQIKKVGCCFIARGEASRSADNGAERGASAARYARLECRIYKAAAGRVCTLRSVGTTHQNNPHRAILQYRCQKYIGRVIEAFAEAITRRLSLRQCLTLTI